MFKKRRAVAPFFKVPPPYNMATGEQAPIGDVREITRVAMFQVIEEDTHDNYLVCRGYDPEENKFYNSINVAKPFLLRSSSSVGTKPQPPYFVGDILACAKPKTPAGDTPGQLIAGEDDGDYPVVEILRDDAGKPITWMDLNSGGRGGPSYSQHVAIRNCTNEALPALSIVGVRRGADPDVSETIESGVIPEYLAYRLDDYSVNSGAGQMLGVTQDAIAIGGTGRACIRGVTFALLHEKATGWTTSGLREWVFVCKFGDRWTFRGGFAGDAKVLCLFTDAFYLDGVYDDQYLVLIDISSTPHKKEFIATGGTVPKHSILNIRNVYAYQFDTVSAGYWIGGGAWPSISGSCGWDVAQGKYGWAYEITEYLPVLVGVPGYVTTNPYSLGPAGGSYLAWPGVPGFKVWKKDWYKAGETTHYYWVTRQDQAFTARVANKTVSGGVVYGKAYIVGANGVHNGVTVVGGYTLPSIIADLEMYSTTKSKCANIADDQDVRCTINPITGKFVLDPGYMDDPIGTMKWINSNNTTIPQGWRKVSGTPFFVRAADTVASGGVVRTDSGSIAYKDFILIERYE